MRIAWAATVVLVAAVHLGAGWQGPLPRLVFAAAVLVGFACLPLVRRVRVSVVPVLGFALTGAYLVARSDGTAPVSVLLDLLPRLLTAARPAPATPALLVPGVLLVFLVALGVALARSLFAPVLGAVVLYTATALLTAGRADPHGVVALALVLLVVLGWLLVDRREAGRQVPIGRPAAVLGVLGAVTLTASVLPGAQAFEPRELVRPPITDVAVTSPLPRLAFWAGNGDAELLRVRGPERPLRLVALADYTGATWRAASLYGPIGAVADPDLPPGARVSEATVDVTVGALGGTWLPAVGRPTAVSIDGAAVDTDSGSLVLQRELPAGLRYEMSGTVDTPDDADLAKASVPTGPEVRRYVALPGLPFSLAEYARKSVAGARTPYEQAVAIEQVVRLGRKPDVEAPVGSSYARLETFLFGAEGQSGANAGTAEQFASAFAVLGRAVGLPTRVVVGFQPVPEGPDGVRVVRGSDATAWPEVYFAGWGWVPFDPVSGTGAGPSAASKREVLDRLASTTASPPTSQSAPPPPPLAQPAAPVAAPAAPKGGPPFALLAIPLVPLALLLSLRGGRRVRLRRAGAPGAWAYVLDSLLLAGRTPRRDRAAPDIARDVAAFAPAAVPLAELADRAAFGPAPTRDPQAWRLAVEVRKGLRRVVPWYRRLFWSVDPRPLRRR
jgi:transglutaminase-like putative cysteine protease